MRLRIVILAGSILLAVSCLPPGQQPLTPDSTSDSLGEQVSAATPEGSHCHSGTLECASGPEAAPCGTWYFDMNESGGITGSAEISSGLPDAPVRVALSGIIDEGVNSYELVLSSSDGGAGELTLSYSGPTLELAGTWSFTNAPEPAGIEIHGGAAGISCAALP